MIYLASKSPRRTELLDQIGVQHSVIEISVDETLNPKVTAKEKCRSALYKKVSRRDHIHPI